MFFPEKASAKQLNPLIFSSAKHYLAIFINIQLFSTPPAAPQTLSFLPQAQTVPKALESVLELSWLNQNLNLLKKLFI